MKGRRDRPASGEAELAVVALGGAGWGTLQRRALGIGTQQMRRSSLFAGWRKSGHLGCCGSWGAGKARPPMRDGRARAWSQRLLEVLCPGSTWRALWWPGLREPSTGFWPTVRGPVVGAEREQEKHRCTASCWAFAHPPTQNPLGTPDRASGYLQRPCLQEPGGGCPMKAGFRSDLIPVGGPLCPV